MTDRAAIRLEQERSRSLNLLTFDDKSIMSEFYDSGSERRFVRVGNAAAKNGTVVAAKGAEADRKINGGEAVRSS